MYIWNTSNEALQIQIFFFLSIFSHFLIVAMFEQQQLFIRCFCCFRISMLKTSKIDSDKILPMMQRNLHLLPYPYKNETQMTIVSVLEMTYSLVSSHQTNLQEKSSVPLY